MIFVNFPHKIQYCSLLNDNTWTKKFDQLAQSPYMYKGNAWVSYEDVSSITAKARLAQTYNLAGVMIKSLDFDDCSNKCHLGNWPLISAVRQGMSQEYPDSIYYKVLIDIDIEIEDY